MLILVFLRMAAESAFYLTFAGLLAPVFRIEPAPLLLAIPILALAFMLSYLLRNRKALRFLPFLLSGGIAFLPGISAAAGVMLLPPFIYMIVLAAKKRYEPEHAAAVSILKLYWKLAIAAVIIAAVVEFSRTHADDWGQFIIESGEIKLLSRQTLPLVLITLTSLVLLTRTLRHDPSVYDSKRLVLVNLLTVVLVAGSAFVASSAWFRDGLLFVLRILGKETFFKRFDAFHIALAIEVGTFFHGFERSPGFRINDIRIFESFFHVMRDHKFCTALLAVFFRNFDDFVHDFVSLGICKRNIHAKAGEQTGNTLRNRQRLSVRGAVCPGHGDFLTFKVLDCFIQIVTSAKFMNAVKHISHTLSRMVDIALEVYQSRLLLQHAGFIALGNCIDYIVHVGIAFADIHVIANADDVCHEGNHVRGFTYGFTVSNLTFAFVKILDFQTEQVARGSKGEAGTG